MVFLSAFHPLISPSNIYTLALTLALPNNLGTWYSILQFLNIIGVVSNAFLVAFTSSWGKQFTTSEKLWIVIGFEVNRANYIRIPRKCVI